MAKDLKEAKRIAKASGYYVGSVAYNEPVDMVMGTDTHRIFSAAKKFK